MSVPSISSLTTLTIPGAFGDTRSTSVAYNAVLSSADHTVFSRLFRSVPSSVFHKFTAHFPLEVAGGEKDITIIIAESLRTARSPVVLLKGCYEITNVGESNSLLAHETKAFANVVFNPETRTCPLTLADHHVATYWYLTEGSADSVRETVVQD